MLQLFGYCTEPEGAAAAQTCLWAIITLKNSPCEWWQYGAAAFNVCGIAYQRSIMYQTADRTSEWRTMPMQLKTFRAYYPSLTLQPLLPSPTKSDSSRCNTMTHHIFNNHVPLFFSFLLSGTNLTCRSGFSSCWWCASSAASTSRWEEGKKRWLLRVERLCNTFKNICKRHNFISCTCIFRKFTLFFSPLTSSKFFYTLCCSLYLSNLLFAHFSAALLFSSLNKYHSIEETHDRGPLPDFTLIFGWKRVQLLF